MAKGGFSSKKLDPRKSSRQTHYRIRVTIPTALGYVCLPKLNAFGETRSRFYLHSSWPDLKAQLTNFSPANKLGQQLIHRFYLDPHWRGQKASFTQDNLQKIVSIFLSIPSVLYPPSPLSIKFAFCYSVCPSKNRYRHPPGRFTFNLID